MVVSGAAMMLPAPTFDALATMQAIHDERATAIYGVPTMFIARARTCGVSAASILRRCGPG